jgi:hypothetical protein
MKNFLIITFTLFGHILFGQINPTLLIDNEPIKIQGETSLPYWIGAGKTMTLGQDAVSASVLEFTINSGNLEFNQALNITSTGTVPTGKVWKIEAIGIGVNQSYNSISNFSNSNVPSIFTSPITFSTPGTYTWTVPPGVTSICIEAWGGGGRGGSGFAIGSSFGYGGGGGGGAYGYQCFTVIPGTSYTVVVGRGGTTSSISNGQASSVSSLISADGGTAGTSATSSTNGLGGVGGSSLANFNISGYNGTNGYNGTQGLLPGGDGGAGANGGVGGDGANTTQSTATQGNFPGGGGGGGGNTTGASPYQTPGNGGNGQIKIYF